MSTQISRLYSWASDKLNNIKITASRQDAEFDQLVVAANRKVLCSGSAPGSPIAGQTWVDTTNKLLKIYRNNEWVGIGALHIGTSAPATLQEGDLWYDTSNNVLKAYNGSSWDTLSTSSGGCLGSYKNLSVVRNSSTQVTVTADELVLEDSSNNKVIIRSVNEAVAITTSGASGLDTGAEASGTWYYIWIIRKSSDGTVNGLLSTSSTSPTMPSDYDQKALVSAVRNDGSSNFIAFTQTGTKYCYTAWQTMASGNVGTGAWTSITTTAYIPSALSNFAFGSISGDTNMAMITNDNTVSTGTTNDRNKFFLNADRGDHHWSLDIITANTLYWGGSAVASAVRIHGFEINKLG